MNGLGTDGGGSTHDTVSSTHNTVSVDAVIVGPLLMAQHIGGIQLPPPPPDVPPSQGPMPSRVFVNRTKELAELRGAALSLAAGPEPGVVLVVGVGGVGKTQLVAQAVRRELHRLFPDGQLYVDLADHRRDGAVDLAAVLGEFLRALRVHKDYVPGGLAERTALFRSVAATLRLLVKVDNVQHAPEVRALVPPQGLLVATGRRVLPSLLMDGAVLIDVAPLDGAAGTELVRRWHADADEGTAADVVRLCAGHPLALRAALEWLAARPQLTLDDVVRDLTAGRYGTGDGGVREATGMAMGAGGGTEEGGVGEAVDTVLDSVVAGVSGHTRHLYDLLGVLPGTTATADLLTATGATQVDEGLGELLSCRLAVLVESSDRPRRYRLHDVVRAHARLRARALPEERRRAVLRLVVDFYADAAAHGDALVLGDRFRIQPPPVRPLSELAARGRCSPAGPMPWSGSTPNAPTSGPPSGRPPTKAGTRTCGGSASRCGRSTTAVNTSRTASSRGSSVSRPPSTRRAPTSRSGCGTRSPGPPTSWATSTGRSPSSTPRRTSWGWPATRG